ncbi:hypothetical protein GCM10009745_19660 [Kribbella yunnanensis]|uniref:2TM domain-containing protein n=1 Tax=Kribbella yunnanensis TaxID=190194 RepID=A0ABN2GTC7_9ACTN
MQAFLLRAPSWVIGVLSGGLFAVLFVVAWGPDTRLGFVVITALVAGAIFGTTLALATRASRREQLRALEEVPLADWKAVRRAAWRGPVPAEPASRAAALDLANRMFARAHRFRILIYIVFSVNLVLAIVQLVVNDQRWHIITLVLWVIALASHWYSLRRLQTRIALLDGRAT